MLGDLLLHPQSRLNLERFVVKPSHALLLVGGAGMGKGTVARALATQLLSDARSVTAEEKLLEMQPVKDTFTIDQVRAIQQFVKLKSVAEGDIKRVILLNDIHLMNIEAQNALLKLLEEPPFDTVILMTAIPGDVLPPTIYSRLQKIQLHAPDETSSADYFISKDHSATEIKKMYVLSGGHTGLLQALLSQRADHPLVAAIEHAKKLLTTSRAEKILAVESLSKSREDSLLFLQATKRIILAAMASAVQQNRNTAVQRWYDSLRLIQRSEETYKSNPNNKLLLTHIMLNV